ncbi:MAG TPA: PQQ-binding-like beta-propeller repeat protein, partial [Gemmatimonadales bacterium]|nr:PQQ-binding-like beta-propeller repeat protein [Gemmatimonadales bacterium]
ALNFRRSIGEQPFRPLVVDSVIYIGTRREILPGVLGNGHVMALNASTGATIWSVAIDDPQDSARGGSVGPVSVTDSLVIVAGMNGMVYALDRSTGHMLWTYNGAGSYSAGLAVVDHSVIVAGDGGSVEGIDLVSGHRLWQTAPGSSVLERITLGDGVALVSVGAVFAFDANGSVRWQSGGAGWGGPVYSTAATYRNGLIYIGSVSPEDPGPGFYALREP